MMAIRAAQLAAILVPAAAIPTYIGCNLQVMPTKVSAGLNIMTTASNIMGAPPVDDENLASTSVVGNTVTITFADTFSRGFVHATAGTFNAPQFSGTAANGAASCGETETIIYKNVGGVTNAITWTPPAVNALNSYTLSFASAPAFGAVSRKSIVVPGAGAGVAPIVAPVAPDFRKITTGTCLSNGMAAIRDISTCEAAAQALQLQDKAATNDTIVPRPEGCYIMTAFGDDLRLNLEDANAGNGAATGFEVLCTIASAATGPAGALAGSSVSPSSGNQMILIVGVVVAVGVVLSLASGYAYYRHSNREKTFDA